MNFFDSYYETARVIPTREARNEFYGAVIEYYYSGEVPPFEHIEAGVAFAASRVNIDNSRKRATAGKAGAESRWGDGKPDGKPDGTSDGKTDGKAKAKRKAKPVAEPMAEPCDSHSDMDMDKDMDRDNPPIVPPYAEIVGHLNDRLGTKFRADSKPTRRLIDGRLSEGYTLEDFIRVIDVKCDAWNRPPKPGAKDMRPYLRPQTLFRPGNFESYVNEIGGGGGVELGRFEKPAGSAF